MNPSTVVAPQAIPSCSVLRVPRCVVHNTPGTTLFRAVPAVGLAGGRVCRISAASSKQATSSVGAECSEEPREASVGGASLWWCLASAAAVELAADAGPALAVSDSVSYNPGGANETLTSLAGVAYVGLVLVFFARLFSKRAKLFTSKRVGGPQDGGDKDESGVEGAKYVQADVEPEAPVNVTPMKAFIGAGQAALYCSLLFGFCTAVDYFFDGAMVPEGYTARNITLSVQTIVRGLSYLLCFLFGANCVGMFSLGVGLIFNPEGVDKVPSAPKPKSDVPKVSLTSDPDDVRRAFEEAARAAARETRELEASNSSK